MFLLAFERFCNIRSPMLFIFIALRAYRSFSLTHCTLVSTILNAQSSQTSFFLFYNVKFHTLFIFTAALRAFWSSFLSHWPWKAPFERFWAIIRILTDCKTCYKKWYRPNRYRKIRYAFEIAANLFSKLFCMRNNIKNRSAAISKA